MESESQLQVSTSKQQNGETSFFKTCFNGLNALAGIGILSMPYAISEGGWLSFMFLIIFAMICYYTALLLEKCMNLHPTRIKSYPDIGGVAFGYKGRAMIAIFIYIELFLIAVELLILEGDNLEKLFPNVSFTIIGLKISGKSGFVILSALVILPTTWLRSLGALAYISVGGIVASIILIGCVVWVGEVDGIGFHESGQLIHLGGLSTSVSLFAFCYCAHAVMPTICNSMKDRTQFKKVLQVCFVTGTIIYSTIAILGYKMFGENLKSQITLNLPTKKISTKIAIITTIINPFTKYAVLITPIINAIEDNWHVCKKRSVTILIRTTIVICSVIVALFVPFFAYVMAFIGAFFNVAISILFPCICYLKLHKSARQFGLELIIIIGIIVVGIFIGVQGTYNSVKKIVRHL